jgi:hypothetical protein
MASHLVTFVKRTVVVHALAVAMQHSGSNSTRGHEERHSLFLSFFLSDCRRRWRHTIQVHRSCDCPRDSLTLHVSALSGGGGGGAGS